MTRLWLMTNNWATLDTDGCGVQNMATTVNAEWVVKKLFVVIYDDISHNKSGFLRKYPQ